MGWRDVILQQKHRQLTQAAREGLLSDAEIERAIAIGDGVINRLGEELDRQQARAHAQARKEVACDCRCADCTKLRNWSVAAFDKLNRKSATTDCGPLCRGGECCGAPVTYTYKAGSAEALVHLGDSSDIVTDDKEVSASGILASGNRDRQGDIVNCAGVDFTEHRWNPIVLWDHGKQYNLPIGLTESEDGEYTVTYHQREDIITQKSYFAPTKFARQIYSLIRGRYIRANSIALKDLEVDRLPPDPDNGHFKPGKLILRSMLAEVTWTPLPANPDAVASLVGKGRISGEGYADEVLDPLILKSFEPFVPDRKAWRTA
jgi:hypothetical protein